MKLAAGQQCWSVCCAVACWRWTCTSFMYPLATMPDFIKGLFISHFKINYCACTDSRVRTCVCVCVCYVCVGACTLCVCVCAHVGVCVCVCMSVYCCVCCLCVCMYCCVCVCVYICVCGERESRRERGQKKREEGKWSSYLNNEHTQHIWVNTLKTIKSVLFSFVLLLIED